MTTPEKETLDLAFKSPEEFNLVMRYLSSRMGYINRVAGGEAKFMIEVSHILGNLGKAFETYCNDKEFNAKFGDGWSKGTVSPSEKREILAELILPQDRFRD